jgi:hypothetical protein
MDCFSYNTKYTYTIWWRQKFHGWLINHEMVEIR